MSSPSPESIITFTPIPCAILRCPWFSDEAPLQYWRALWLAGLGVFEEVFPWVHDAIMDLAGLAADTPLAFEGKHEHNLAYNAAHNEYLLGTRSTCDKVRAIHERQNLEWEELTNLSPLATPEEWWTAATRAGATPPAEFSAADFKRFAGCIIAWAKDRQAIKSTNPGVGIDRMSSTLDSTAPSSRSNLLACEADDRVVHWLAIKRRESASVAAKVFHEYLTSIDAPAGTIERAEGNGWVKFVPGSAIGSLVNGAVPHKVRLKDIRPVEASYTIQAVVRDVARQALQRATDASSNAQGASDASSDSRLQVETDPMPVDRAHLMANATPGSGSTSPQPFQGGTMVFFADRVELCGVVICRNRRSGTSRKILDLLRKKAADGSFEDYSGTKLMAAAKIARADAASAIRDLRLAIKNALKTVSIRCEKEDVILGGGPGYRLSQKLSVQDGTPVLPVNKIESERAQPDRDERDAGERERAHGERDERGAGKRERDHDELSASGQDASVDAESDPAAMTQSDRQNWILGQLRAERKLRIAHVESELSVSNATARRDLGSLKEQRLITFVPKPHPGHYSLAPLPAIE